MEFSRVGCSGGLVAGSDGSGQVDSVEFPVPDQTICLITFLPRVLPSTEVLTVTLLTRRLFDGGMRLLFFQGQGSECRCQVNAAGFFFPSIFHRAPVPAHQSLMSCFISLPCCLSAFLAPPCSPKLLLASQPSGTPRWWYWRALYRLMQKTQREALHKSSRAGEAVFQP